MNTYIAPGQKFGYWTIMGPEISRNRRCYFFCACICGTEREVLKTNLNRGTSTNCGCEGRKAVIKFNTKHGQSTRTVQSSEYRSWLHMRQRCTNPNYKQYKDYGGRGISVCAEWEDFGVFIDYMGNKPTPEHSIERIDNNGNYEPGNVKWATREEQQYNMQATIRLTHNGQTLTIKDWSKLTGLKPRIIYNRIKYYNWPVERALTTPAYSTMYSQPADTQPSVMD